MVHAVVSGGRGVPGRGLGTVSRLATFDQLTLDREDVGGIRGLSSLTEPAADEPVGAIVDVAVIGARGDGKTQFIVHAIRTLRAYAPLLAGTEHQYNRDVLQVVMNAREPRPEATAPGVVPHYVFRIRPRSLLAQVGALGRLALYARVAGLWTLVLLALGNALAVGALLYWLQPELPMPVVVSVSLGLFGLGTLIATWFARHRFVGRGDIEIVFWDVAGEHVYSSSAADYYSFLSALVRMRREHASPSRAYAFAPVLICNPVALGTRAEGSSYARLRKLIPLFASLNEPLARAMVAINRWTVVKEVCAPDSDREELVAVVARARAADGEEGDEGEDEDGEDGEGDDGSGQTGAVVGLEALRNPLPVVKREVVRKHCLDAEDGMDNEVHFTYLRYDAGMQCAFREQTWRDWHAMDKRTRSRWRAPTVGTPALTLHYEFEDGPGSFEGQVRRGFLEWVAGLAFHPASFGKGSARRRWAPDDHDYARDEDYARDADADADADNNNDNDDHAETRMFGREPRADMSGPRPRKTESRAARAPRPDASPDARPGAEPRERISAADVAGRSSRESSDLSAWRPRPLSATGMEEFARGTMVREDLLSDAIDVSLDKRESESDGAANGADSASKPDSTDEAELVAPVSPAESPAESPAGSRNSRPGTDRGFGSLDDTVMVRASTLSGGVKKPALVVDDAALDKQTLATLEASATPAPDAQATLALDTLAPDTRATPAPDAQATQVLDTLAPDTRATPTPDAQATQVLDTLALDTNTQAQDTQAPDAHDDKHDDKDEERSRERNISDTLRMPGGFGSGGT